MIRLARPVVPKEDITAMLSVIKSGNLVQGEFVNIFEENVKKYLRVKNALLVSSGTAALHLALLGLNLKRGDEVIVPSFTFPATTNVIEVVQAKTVLVDINLSDFCMNVSQIEDKITEKTKAIIVVHEFGQPAEMDKIVKMADRYNIAIVEDAACALGSKYKDKNIGTLGKIGCFSLHPRKAITTGEGGILVTNDDTLADTLKALRNHGISYVDGKIHFKYAGLNYRMTDFQAAMAINQFKDIDKSISTRRKQVEIYSQGFKNNKYITTPEVFEERMSSWQSYHILIDDKFNRDVLIIKLKELGVETNYGAYAINTLDYYKEKYKFRMSDFSNAVTAYERGLVLPLGDHVSKEDSNFIIDKINEVLS